MVVDCRQADTHESSGCKDKVWMTYLQQMPDIHECHSYIFTYDTNVVVITCFASFQPPTEYAEEIVEDELES